MKKLIVGESLLYRITAGDKFVGVSSDLLTVGWFRILSLAVQPERGDLVNGLGFFPDY